MLSLDLIAFATFAVLFVGYHYVTSYRPLVDRSIVGAIQKQRIAWMRSTASC